MLAAVGFLREGKVLSINALLTFSTLNERRTFLTLRDAKAMMTSVLAVQNCRVVSKVSFHAKISANRRATEEWSVKTLHLKTSF